MKNFSGLTFLIFSLIFALFSSFPALAYEKTLGITDKEIVERLTRLEAGQEALQQRMDDMNKAINARIDDLWNLTLSGFAVLFALIIALFGYIVWDRRTALRPLVEEQRKIKSQLSLDSSRRWRDGNDG